MIAAFRSFVGWLKRRRKIRKLPEFPWPKVPEHEPRVLTLETQDAILAAIPETDRGIFLALARMGLHPGEAVALEAADYQDGWLHVTRAVKGRRLTDPVRAPKNNRGKRLPVDPELQAWIERYVPAERRARGGLLFENARAKDRARRWTPTSLHRRGETACRAVGLTAPISLYEGTKHTFVTNAKRRGVEDRLLQRFLGHRDRRSVERYARPSSRSCDRFGRHPRWTSEKRPSVDVSRAALGPRPGRHNRLISFVFFVVREVPPMFLQQPDRPRSRGLDVADINY